MKSVYYSALNSAYYNKCLKITTNVFFSQLRRNRMKWRTEILIARLPKPVIA